MQAEAPTVAARWPVLRVQPGHDVEVMLLSSDWLRLNTHFHKRTVLCSESLCCPLCPLLPSRPYWYLPVSAEPRKTFCLLELSPSASSSLEQTAKFANGAIMAGQNFRLWRRAKKKPIGCEWLGLSKGACTVSVSEWVSPLMAIYGLPILRPGETIEEYGGRVASTVDQRNELVAASLKAAAERRPAVR